MQKIAETTARTLLLQFLCTLGVAYILNIAYVVLTVYIANKPEVNMINIEDIEYKERESHPFKKMDIGDIVTVNSSLQSYVHAYGSNCGKKFVTRKSDGKLHVKRVR